MLVYPITSIQYRVSSIQQPAASIKQPVTSKQYPENMIFLGQHQHPADPAHLAVEQIRAQLQYRKQQNPTFTQATIAEQASISASTLSRILNGRTPLNAEYQHKLYTIRCCSNPKHSSRPHSRHNQVVNRSFSLRTTITHV